MDLQLISNECVSNKNIKKTYYFKFALDHLIFVNLGFKPYFSSSKKMCCGWVIRLWLAHSCKLRLARFPRVQDGTECGNVKNVFQFILKNTGSYKKENTFR